MNMTHFYELYDNIVNARSQHDVGLELKYQRKIVACIDDYLKQEKSTSPEWVQKMQPLLMDAYARITQLESALHASN